MAARSLVVVLLCGLIAAACTPTSSDSPKSSSEAPAATTTSDAAAQDRVTTTTTIVAEPIDLDPPERGDPGDVASDAFWDAGDFRVADEPNLFDQDALTAIEQWLPEDLVDALIWEVFSRDSDTNVLAVSVIPTLTWRGDPNFVPAIIETLSDTTANEVVPGIFEAETPIGLLMYLWSTGDGFVIAASLSGDKAVAYLEALSAETDPHAVWEPQSCLYINPDAETLPYAPFPSDIVVPCSGPHNAEVLIAEQIGTDLHAFDADTIEYDRNYRCDKAYEEAFGAQKDHAPTLITYMPDSDEWDRGDRYLACVVQLETIEGPLLVAGPMAERTDLDWNPMPEACFDRSFAPETVECGRPHGYQYLGEVTVSFDEWPDDGSSAFASACDELVDEFVRTGPVSVDVFATGLFPYAFERGDRTVQCMAFAVDEGVLLDVVGSFGDVWRVIGSGGIAA